MVYGGMPMVTLVKDKGGEMAKTMKLADGKIVGVIGRNGVADKTPKKKKQSKRKDKMDAKDVRRKKLLRKLGDIRFIAEIGVWHGRFSRILLDECRPMKLYLIDPWTNDDDEKFADAFVGTNQKTDMQQVYDGVVERFSQEIKNGIVEMRREFSDTALAKFEDEALDLVYIDGDHSYEGVKKDLLESVRVVRKGGFIMLDDYHRRGWWGDGVIRAIHETLGAHATTLRVHAVEGAQILIQKLEDLPKDP